MEKRIKIANKLEQKNEKMKKQKEEKKETKDEGIISFSFGPMGFDLEPMQK